MTLLTSMVDLPDFNPRILREVAGAPDPIIQDCLMDAARFFCKNTHLWIEDVDDIMTYAGIASYDIEPVPQGRFLAIVGATQNGLSLRPKSERELNDIWPGWRQRQASTARFYVSDDPTTLTIVPYPQPTATTLYPIVNIRMAFQPTLDATQLPSILFEDYLETIGYGALERLFRIPKTTWGDMKMSAYYGGMFQGEIDSAKIRVLKNFQNTPLSARPTRLPWSP